MTGHWRPIGLTTGRMGEAMFSEQIVFDREAIRSWRQAGLVCRGIWDEAFPVLDLSRNVRTAAGRALYLHSLPVLSVRRHANRPGHHEAQAYDR